jgi:leucyl-tRNA synthetase
MILAEDGEKMSKSRGNVVNPDGIVEKYGADTLRLFEMFLGPLEKTKPWQTQSIEGVFRFLSRTFRLITDGTEHLSPKVKNSPESEWGESLVQSLHKAIHDVGQDYERMGFNTAISTLMVLVNEGTAYKEAKGQLPKAFCESLVLMLAPMAPHLCEELWQLLGHSESLARAPWPSFDPKHLKASTIEIAIQVNGKLRDTVSVSPDITEDAIKELVLKREAVQKWLEGRAPNKVIYVKQKLVSVVV